MLQDGQAAEKSKPGETRRHKASGSKVRQVDQERPAAEKQTRGNPAAQSDGSKPRASLFYGWARLPHCRMCKFLPLDESSGRLFWGRILLVGIH